MFTPIFFIDLDSPARLPSGMFSSSVLQIHRGSGIVELCRRGNVLLLNGKPLNLFYSLRQKKHKSLSGRELRHELENRGNNVGAKVLDCLEDNSALCPDNWKRDDDGNTPYFHFWDDIFLDMNRLPCVRFGRWSDGRVVSDCSLLDGPWRFNSAVSSARK